MSGADDTDVDRDPDEADRWLAAHDDAAGFDAAANWTRVRSLDIRDPSRIDLMFDRAVALIEAIGGELLEYLQGPIKVDNSRQRRRARWQARRGAP